MTTTYKYVCRITLYYKKEDVEIIVSQMSQARRALYPERRSEPTEEKELRKHQLRSFDSLTPPHGPCGKYQGLWVKPMGHWKNIVNSESEGSQGSKNTDLQLQQKS